MTSKKTIKELYISCDVEADGSHPGQYSMVSLGAVAAATLDSEGVLTRLDVDSDENRFKVEIKPISETWMPDALAITGLSREHFEENGLNAYEAMTKFVYWCESVKAQYGANSLVFAAFPLGFDWMWVYWYICEFLGRDASPFGHSRHIDIKTEYRSKSNSLTSRAIKRNMPKSLRSKRPHTHDPLDDAIEQAELLQNLLEWKGKHS